VFRRTVGWIYVQGVLKTELVMRTALFWAVTLQVVVIPFRRFGKTNLSFMQEPRWILDRTDLFSRNVGKELHCFRCRVALKRAFHVYFAA